MRLASASGKPPHEIEQTWTCEELYLARIHELIDPPLGSRLDVLLTLLRCTLININGGDADFEGLFPRWGAHLEALTGSAIAKVKAMFAAGRAEQEAKAARRARRVAEGAAKVLDKPTVPPPKHNG